MNIEEIRGDLNVFQRAARAVDFAVIAVEAHNKREARNKELDKMITDASAKLISINGDIADAEGELEATKHATQKVLEDARAEANRILSNAKDQADKLIGAAERRNEELVDRQRELEADINTLNERAVEARRKADEAEKSLAKAASAVESALSSVKAKG